MSKNIYNIKYPNKLNNISELRDIILINRIGHVDKEYINNDFDIYKNILELKDIDKGALLLKETILNKKRICICSDLDADGLTSAAMCYRTFTEVFKIDPNDIDVIINHRRNGNSYNNVYVNRIITSYKNNPFDLIISFDQGSRNEEQYKYMKSVMNNVKFIITDHHQIDYNEYPNSVEVFINPQRNDSLYDKDISGCTVGFLLMLYTYKLLYNKTDIKPFYPIFPYPAISVISDVMSCLSDVNRYIYKVGMNRINSFQDPWIVLLFKSLNKVGVYTNRDISMSVASIINSANRMGIEEEGYGLISSTSAKTIQDHLDTLNSNNNIKKTVVNNISNDLLSNLEEHPVDGGIVCYIDTDININGLIAGRIASTKKLPVICFIKNDNVDNISGSCRAGINGFNLLDCFNIITNRYPDLIINYGGHKDACGVHIKQSKLDKFKEVFYNTSKEIMSNMDIDRTIDVDVVLYPNKGHINPDLINIIRSLEPYGKNFESPTFMSTMTLDRILKFGKTMCRLEFKVGKQTFGGFCSFDNNPNINMDNILDVLVRGLKYNVIYKIDLVDSRNKTDYQLEILYIEEINNKEQK